MEAEEEEELAGARDNGAASLATALDLSDLGLPNTTLLTLRPDAVVGAGAAGAVSTLC